MAVRAQRRLPVLTGPAGRVRLRKARRSDCRDLGRIARAAKKYWGYPETLMRLWTLDLTVTPDFVARHHTVCALAASRVIGFYALSGERERRELEHFWVHPTYIQKGVGRLLFDHAVRHLRRTGATRLRIASDPNAEGFYRRFGARRAGKVRSKPAGRYLPLLVLHVPPDRRRSPRAGLTPRPRPAK